MAFFKKKEQTNLAREKEKNSIQEALALKIKVEEEGNREGYIIDGNNYKIFITMARAKSKL